MYSNDCYPPRISVEGEEFVRTDEPHCLCADIHIPTYRPEGENRSEPKSIYEIVGTEPAKKGYWLPSYRTVMAAAAERRRKATIEDRLKERAEAIIARQVLDLAAGF